MFFPVIDKSLNSNDWSVSLQIANVRLSFQIKSVLVDVLDYEWIEVDLDLLHSNVESVVVLVSLLVEFVSESKLHRVSEWVNNVLSVHAHLIVEDIFHHLKNRGGLKYFKDAILVLMTLVPDTGGHEQLTHCVPVETDVPHLLQLADCA